MGSRGILRLLGAKIRMRREASGMTQEALAEAANVHVNVVGRLERGVYNPSVLKLHAIIAALDVSLSTLFESIGE
jgi:transcriptional regulator with XRE-family HTH domain